MKREAWDHPKFKLVARDLQLPLCYVRGIMESIWLATGIHWFRGDIGRWSNEEIAVSIEYPGDADRLIEVLVNRRLLDRLPDSEGRLYVHDWHIHCDKYTNLKVLKSKTCYANGMPARTKDREEPQEPEEEQDTQLKDSESAVQTVKPPLASQENVKPPLTVQAGVSPKPEPEPEPENTISPPPPNPPQPWLSYPEPIRNEQFHELFVRWCAKRAKAAAWFPEPDEIAELLEWLAGQPDPEEVVRRSIRYGWITLHEVEEKKSRKPKSDFDPLQVALPANMKGEGGAEAWRIWVSYNADMGFPLPRDSVREQLVELSKCRNPVEVIARAVSGRWKGLNVKPEDIAGVQLASKNSGVSEDVKNRKQPMEGLDFRKKYRPVKGKDGDACTVELIRLNLDNDEPFDERAWFEARNLPSNDHPLTLAATSWQSSLGD